MKSSFYLKYALKQGAIVLAVVAVVFLMFGPLSAFLLKEDIVFCLLLFGAVFLLTFIPMCAASAFERTCGSRKSQPVDDAWRKEAFDNICIVGCGVFLCALNLYTAIQAFIGEDLFRGSVGAILAVALLVIMFGRGIRGLRKLARA